MYSEAVRRLVIVLFVIFAGCSQPRPGPPVQQPSQNPVLEPGYVRNVEQLVEINRQAETALAKSRLQETGEAIQSGLALRAKLLKTAPPTLAAAQAISDLDDLYGRILMARKQYGYARMQFQQNVARWKAWMPRSEETARRLKLAQERIAECDRKLGI